VDGGLLKYLIKRAIPLSLLLIIHFAFWLFLSHSD
jgi:hypothetical protein